MVRTDFALEGVDRAGLGAERFIIPSLDRRKPQDHPLAGNRVPPFLGGQFLELGLELATGRRCRQKRPDHAEPKMRPALMDPQAG